MYVLHPPTKAPIRPASRRTAARIGAILLAVLFSSRAGVAEPEDRLEPVLRRMETASRSFRSFAADTASTRYTAIVNAFDAPEKGIFLYRRADDGSALIRWEIRSPGKRILTIRNDEALVYEPNINSARRYRLGKNRDKAEYLALGIGQSPSDLRKTFHIAYRGGEKIRGNACSILVLKPKDPKAAAMFASITVWIKDSTGVSARMKLEEPSGDYFLVNFSSEQLNRPIDESRFRQRLSSGVEMMEVF